MEQKKGKVLVLGDDTRSFLATIRSLGRAGIKVHIAWHREQSAARSSRYIAQAWSLPPFDENESRWKDEFVGLVQREHFDLVIPCHDSSLIPLQRYHHEFEPHARLALPGQSAFVVLFDKFKTAALARSLNINVPREIVISEIQDAEQLRSAFSLPLVLKPRASFTHDEPDKRNIVRKAYTWEAFDDVLREMLQVSPVAIQENFVGFGAGVELLLDRGKPILEFQHIRLHEPPMGGGSSYRMSVPVNPELLEASLKLFRSLNYSGVAMAEFKINPRSNQWMLIEVNARLWGSLPLAIAAGADFPLALYEYMVDGRTEFPLQYQSGICCRNLMADAYWQVANFRADHRDPTLLTVPIPKVIGESIAHLCTLREHTDEFVWDDPRPAIVELRNIMSQITRAIRKRVFPRLAHFYPIRRRLSHRARSLLKNGKTILFVCKGNICRSPFAEHFAKKVFPTTTTVMSAGYYPKPGRPAPPDAIAAAAKNGVDLSSHRSQLLTLELLRQADAVIVFDYENYDRLITEFGYDRKRIGFLGATSNSGPLFIKDPWGTSLGCFSETYSAIARAISVLR